MPSIPHFEKLPKVLREFLIYGICGVGSLCVFYTFYHLSVTLLPDPVSDNLPDHTRAKNLIYYQIVAFIPANIWAWWSNRTFVFDGRRHEPWQELLMIFGIAAASFALSFGLPTWLVSRYGIPNSVATLLLAMLSAIWNFILRRLWVFGTH